MITNSSTLKLYCNARDISGHQQKLNKIVLNMVITMSSNLEHLMGEDSAHLDNIILKLPSLDDAASKKPLLPHQHVDQPTRSFFKTGFQFL